MSQFIRKGLELYVRVSHKPHMPNALVIRADDFTEGLRLAAPRFFTGLGPISYNSPFGKEILKNKALAVDVVDQAISDMIFGDSHKT